MKIHNDWYVEIVEHNTERVEKRMGPFSERKAERVGEGVDINLDHERFYVRCKRAATAKKEPDHAEEVLIHVYWTHLNGQEGHRMVRDRVSADLGLGKAPHFTRDEMQSIAYAAKMAALQCLMNRKPASKAKTPRKARARS